MHHLLHHLYNSDGWIRGRDDLCCEGRYQSFCQWLPDTNFFLVQPQAKKGYTALLKIFSIASSVIIALGLLYVTCPFAPDRFAIRSSKHRPQYWEIYRRKEVIGISMTFMAVDITGGVFSILSLAFKEKFDVFASIAYIVVIASHLFFIPSENPRSYSILCVHRLWMRSSLSPLSS